MIIRFAPFATPGAVPPRPVDRPDDDGAVPHPVVVRFAPFDGAGDVSCGRADGIVVVPEAATAPQPPPEEPAAAPAATVVHDAAPIIVAPAPSGAIPEPDAAGTATAMAGSPAGPDAGTPAVAGDGTGSAAGGNAIPQPDDAPPSPGIPVAADAGEAGASRRLTIPRLRRSTARRRTFRTGAPENSGHRGPPSGGAVTYTVRDVLMMAFYHRRVILTAFLLVLAIGIAAAVTSRTRYTSDGRLLIMATQDHAADELGDRSLLSMDGIKSIEAELQILQSREVLARTVDRIGPEILFPDLGKRRLFGLLPAWPRQDIRDRAIDQLRRELQTDVEPNSNILRVSLAHTDPEVAADTVNTVMEIYRTRRQEIFNNDRSPFLSEQMAKYGDQLQSIEAQIQQLQASYNLVDPEQQIILAVNQADTILQRQRQTMERREALRGELSTARARLAALPHEVFDFKEATNNGRSPAALSTLMQLRVDREKMASQYQDNHPQLQDLDRQIGIVRNMMDSDRSKSTTTRDVRNPAIGFLTNHEITLMLEADGLDQQLKELARQRQAADQRVGQLREAKSKLEDLQRTEAIVEGIYKDYAQRTEAARIEQDAAKLRMANARVIQVATVPTTGRNMALVYLGIGIFGGIAAGAMAGVGAAWTRQVFVLPTEAERSLGMIALAVLNDNARGQFEKQNKVQIEQLATRLLDYAVDGRRMTIVQFLTGHDGQGQTEIIRALAREVAGHTRRVLLMDFRTDGRSHCAALLDSARHEGLDLPTAAEDGNDPVTEIEDGGLAVTRTAIANLSVTVDARDSDFGIMRTSLPELGHLFDGLAMHHDLILLDCPPLESSYLGARLAPLVDGTLLVIRAERTRTPVASRLRDSVLDAGGDILGLVMTGRRFHIPKFVYRWL